MNNYAKCIVRRRNPVQILFRVRRKLVACVSWLLLLRSLFTLGDITLFEAPLDAGGHVIRDLGRVDQGARWESDVRNAYPGGNAGDLFETDVS